MKLVWCVCLAGLALTAVASRAETLPTTLAMNFDDALAGAYESNPRLLAARRQLAQTDEGVPQALAGWRPRVTINGSFGGALFDDNMDPVNDPERRLPQQYALQLSQTIYAGGEVRARVRQAEAEVRAQRASLRATEAEVLLEAGSAYLDVLRDRQVVALTRHQVEVQANTVQASRVELAAGGLAAADLGQARARLATAQAQLAAAEASLSDSEAAFEHHVGQPPGALSTPDHLVTLPPSRDSAISQALRDNPDVAQARSAVESGRQGIDVERARLLPHLSFNAALERLRDTDIQKLNQRDNAVQGTLDVTFPLYQGGGEYSRIRQAKERAYRLDDLLEEASRQARQLASSAWDQVQASRRRVAAEGEAIAGNQSAVRGYTAQQLVGARTLLDVLVTQQDLLASQVARVTAEHDLLVASLQLAAATGRLDASALALHVPIYDPETHYDQVRNRWIGTTPPP
jgi:outer membrane protein